MRQTIIVASFAVCLLVAGGAAADIEIHQEHTFAARPGATVVIDVSFHEIEVSARPGETVEATVDLTVMGDGGSAKSTANDLSPVFLDEGDRLVIRSTRKGGWSWRSVKARGKVKVLMPPGMHLTIDSSSGSSAINGDFGEAVVRFDASSGNLSMDGAMAELHADVSSGNIRATVSRPLNAFTADASSGSVQLSGGARSATVDTSSGSIKLSGLLGEGRFDASSGSITAQWDAIPPDTRVRASASSGSVTLRFPPNTRISGTVGVSSGGIHSDFPALVRSKDKVELDGGDGAIDLIVETSSGSVRLLSN